MEDILWSIIQRSRVLQELRKDIRGIWQDEAARDLTSRYLNPHETEDQQMLSGLNQQKEALEQAHAKVIVSEELARQAEEHATSVIEGLKAAEQELQSAYAHYDTFAQYNAESQAKFPSIKKLMNQANSACNA